MLVMRGTPATAGSKILKGYLPPYDATAVTRLEIRERFCSGSSTAMSSRWVVRMRTLHMGQSGTHEHWIECREAQAADRLQRWLRTLP